MHFEKFYAVNRDFVYSSSSVFRIMFDFLAIRLLSRTVVFFFMIFAQSEVDFALDYCKKEE